MEAPQLSAAAHRTRHPQNDTARETQFGCTCCCWFCAPPPPPQLGHYICIICAYASCAQNTYTHANVQFGSGRNRPNDHVFGNSRRSEQFISHTDDSVCDFLRGRTIKLCVGILVRFGFFVPFKRFDKRYSNAQRFSRNEPSHCANVI